MDQYTLVLLVALTLFLFFVLLNVMYFFFFFCLRRLELDLYQIQNHARAIGIDEILLFAGDYSI